MIAYKLQGNIKEFEYSLLKSLHAHYRGKKITSPGAQDK